MYKDKRILALIPARGGSKGIKNKNIISLDGQPLISYTIECGLNSRYIDDVVVTTDSEIIAETALQYGAQVPFLRPEELAKDTSPTIESVLHAICALRDLGKEYDSMILLQPTQPLRTSEDVDLSIEEFYKHDQRPLISVSLVNDHPILMRLINEDGKLEKLIPANQDCRRQDMPPYYRINGCIYISRIADLNESTCFSNYEIPFIMKQSHSVDIDEPADLAVAEYYLANRHKSNV